MFVSSFCSAVQQHWPDELDASRPNAIYAGACAGRRPYHHTRAWFPEVARAECVGDVIVAGIALEIALGNARQELGCGTVRVKRSLPVSPGDAC
mmetsp:Transcript_43589/g.78719  ORF Transcript_43589/g.78719 Transcript_43589/m.78719 type:complete len:94 (+) Transcript_43589:139-420(+)